MNLFDLDARVMAMKPEGRCGKRRRLGAGTVAHLAQLEGSSQRSISLHNLVMAKSRASTAVKTKVCSLTDSSFQDLGTPATPRSRVLSATVSSET